MKRYFCSILLQALLLTGFNCRAQLERRLEDVTLVCTDIIYSLDSNSLLVSGAEVNVDLELRSANRVNLDFFFTEKVNPASIIEKLREFARSGLVRTRFSILNDTMSFHSGELFFGGTGLESWRTSVVNVQIHKPIGGWERIEAARIIVAQKRDLGPKQTKERLANFSKLYVPVTVIGRKANEVFRRVFLFEYDMPFELNGAIHRSNIIELQYNY